jgi:hypothetical protein
MKQLNLVGATLEDIEKFISDCFFQQDIVKVSVETGEYGMLLFHTLLQKKEEKEIKTDLLSELTLLEDLSCQFIKYSITGGKVLLLKHNSDLDDRDASKIDNTTGFPIMSSTLFLL